MACGEGSSPDSNLQTDSKGGTESGGTSTGMPAGTSGVTAGEGGAALDIIQIAGQGGLAGTASGGSNLGPTGDGGLGGEHDTPGEGGKSGEADGGGAGGAYPGEDAAAGSPTVDPTEIVLLDVAQRPYTECGVFKRDAEYPHDEDGIPLKPYRGTLQYNPVRTAQAGLEWLACYRESHDEWYLESARKAAHHLIDTSTDADGAMFFPYTYNFYLHGNKSNVAIAPWYSGMAQGHVLSLFSRLGELTSEAEWEVAANDTLKSFDRVRGKDDPWIIDIDDNSLWIEEYAAGNETHVLNGFLFAMFGVYDYYAWKQDEHAAKLFRQGVHTLRVNVERFRNPGEASAYCLTHRVQSGSYHAIHIAQLDALTQMTGDPYFAYVSDLFEADYSPL